MLLRWGTNGFTFGVQNSGGYDACVIQDNLVMRISPQLGIEKPLFNVRREGTAFTGETSLSLSLEEINPPLTRSMPSPRDERGNERAG